MTCEDVDMRQELALLSIRTGTVESWFALLNVDERVIVRQILLGDKQEAVAARITATRWMRQLAACHQAPWELREQVMGKITGFALRKYGLIRVIFRDS